MHKSRVRFKNKQIFRKITIILLIIGSLIFLQIVLGGFFSTAAVYTAYFSSEDRTDISTYVPLDSNYLATRERQFNTLLDNYHLPKFEINGHTIYLPLSDCRIEYAGQNFDTRSSYASVADPLNFSNPYNQVERYDGTGHNVFYAGLFLMGQAFKYAVGIRESNITLQNEALERIWHQIHAINLFTNITRTGALVRWAVPDIPETRNIFSENMFIENYHENHPNWKIYDENLDVDWYVSTGTSGDLYLGVFMGLIFTWLFVNIPEIKVLVKNIIDRMLEFMENTGWRYLDPADGKVNNMGAELLNAEPISDPNQILTFLNLGKIVSPKKWTEPYNNYYYDLAYNLKAGMHQRSGVYNLLGWFGNYFPGHLQLGVGFLYSFFQNSTSERHTRYLENFQSIWEFTRWHRNAHLDTLYLCTQLPQKEGSILPDSSFDSYDDFSLPLSELEYLQKDIIDGLMRYAYAKYPQRNFKVPEITTNYLSDPYFEPVFGNLDYYYDIGVFDIGFKNQYTMLIENTMNTPDMANMSLPADLRHSETLIWERSPFRAGGGNNGLRQYMPVDYLTPYWLARYCYVL